MTKLSQPAVVETGYHAESQSWILASQGVKPWLSSGVAWADEFSSFGSALKCLTAAGAKKIKIAAHGNQDCIDFGVVYSNDDLKKQLKESHLEDQLTQVQITLWSCFGGAQGGVGEVLSHLTGASISASSSEVGCGAGISQLTDPDCLDEELRNLPITLHTNAVGFEVIDNLNGTFGLVVYYGTWHQTKVQNTVTEGALSLYTLAPGKDGSNPANYTVEAYGQGGAVQNQTFLPSNPPKITGNVFIPDQNIGDTASGNSFIQGKDGLGKQDITDIGFKPGENFFFSKDGDTTLYAYNSLDGVGIAPGFQGTYGFQSIYIPTVAPGTYKSYYDGKSSFDSTQPVGANTITAIFEPAAGIASSLFTITGSGKLIFGEAPKILIGSIDFDNGASKTDFVTTGKQVVINGTYSNVTAGDESTIEVTVTNKATLAAQTFTATDSELAVDNAGKWVLSMPSELAAEKYDIDAKIVHNSTTYTATQELNIVSASIESISEDNGVSATDKKTSDQTLIFNGIFSSKTATDIKLSLKDSSNQVIFQDQAPTTKIGDDWSFDYTGTTLALGTYSLSATVSDATGDATASQDIVIQSLPPAPVIVSIEDDTDTPGDFSTTDTTLKVSGTFDNTAVPSLGNGILNISLAGNTYLDGGTNPLTVDYAAGTWSFDSKTLDVGQYVIEGYIVDTNGLFNSSTKTLSIVDAADVTPPQVPTIDSIDSDTGIAGDFNTVDTSIKIIGTYDSTDALGGLVVEFNGATYQLGTNPQLTTIGNSWALTVPGIATTGTAKVTITDGGGNQSSATQNITISPAPSVKFVSLVSDSGIAGDFITNDETITINGTFEEAIASSGSFEIKFGGQTYTLASSELSNTGDNWSLVVPGKATSGLAEATLTDSSGNEGKANQSIVIDVTAPTKPTISAIDKDTGTAGDFTTIDTSIDITGTYDSSDGLSEFSVSFGGKKYVLGVDAALTSNSDDWKLAVPGVASTGTVTATAIDKAGNISPNSQKITILNTGITIAPSGGNNANKGFNQLIFESGQSTSTTFTVVLNAPPTGDVTVTLSGYDKDKYSLSSNILTFTKDNWNKPQTVTIKTIDNSVIAKDVVDTIVATASNSGGYNGTEKSTLSLVSKAGSIAINPIVEQAENLDLLVTSKINILKGVATLTDSAKAISSAAKSLLAAKGIALGNKAISYDQKVNKEHADANFNLNIASLASNLNLAKGDNKKFIYYQVGKSGELTPYNYNPISQTGARYFDTNGDGIYDFISLSQIDGNYGDLDAALNENINTLSTLAAVDLNPTFDSQSNGLVTCADLNNSSAPGSFDLKATLTSRGNAVQSIGYILIDPSEFDQSGSIMSDLAQLKQRSVHLFSGLEATDVNLASSFNFMRDIQFINGQYMRFFTIDDAGLSDITDINDSRFSWLEHSVLEDGSLKISGGDNVVLTLQNQSAASGLSALIAQDQHVSCVMDFSPFTGGQTVTGVVEMAREADFDAVCGFYRTVDNLGRVIAADGSVLSPGDVGYKEAALLQSNRVAGIDNLSVNDNETKEVAFSLSEFTHIAPYAIVNGESLFSFAAANSDGLSHFFNFGDNLFGLEDTIGGGDKDYDDVLIGFNFTALNSI